MSGPPLALVGCGRWGRNILRDLRALRCEVVVADRSADARAWAASAGASTVVDDPADLPTCDGVVVATSTSAHAAVIEQVAAFEVPIFCEKPLTADPADARRVVARCGDRLFVMDKWRYHPGVEALAGLAAGGTLGQVVGVRTVRVQPSVTQPDIDEVWVLLPHDLSIVREVLGSLPPPRWAVGERDHARPEGDHLSGLTGLLGDDPWAIVDVGAGWPVRRREVHVRCTDGAAFLDGADDTSVSVLRDGHAERMAVDATPPLLLQLRAFVDHLGGGPPPKASAADGLATVELIAELRRLALGAAQSSAAPL